MAKYYPNSHPPRLNEDLRLLYDHVYSLQDRMKAMQGENVPKATPHVAPGGPSSTKIAGLNVHASPPTQGNQVTTLSKTPMLGYNARTGEIEWFILP